MGARVLFYACSIENMGVNKFEKLISSHGLNNINQVVAGDITYLILQEKTYYVFTLKDAYSKRIVGLYGSDRMLASNAVSTLKQLIQLRGKSDLKGLIHHSDAGTQYKSNLYKKWLGNCKIKMSIAENCLQNGMAEQLNGILKNDYINFEAVKNVKQLNRALTYIKNLINDERPVEELKYKTPIQFENWIKMLPENKRPIIKLYDFAKRDKL